MRHSIDSVELLEVLLLLREDRARAWTAEQLSAELRSSPHSIARRLAHLQRRRLAAVESGSWRYAGAAKDDRLVRRLAELYRERPTTVIDFIFSPPSDTLQSFSDAFKVGDGDADR
ncbi:MAG TPA: hypothetical protein VHS78_17845 [Candidatus Elarobacter sp.]|nr:hypothetical protein [Candidatus Elarobacter sp.]